MTNTLPRKRKTLSDFFAPVASSSKKLKGETGKAGSSPFTGAIPAVPGLCLLPHFITSDEEASILSFLSTQIWRTDLQRRCLHFGGTYCLFNPQDRLSKPEIKQALPMPEELTWLLDRFVERGVYKAEERPQYCIVNEYIGAQGISAHVENFSFAEP